MGVQACPLPRPGGPSLPFAMLHPAANRHPKATHQCLLIGVQACRLPALKRLKPLKTLQTLKTLTTRHGGPSLPFARPARPHINGFLWASQACRLPGLKHKGTLACFILAANRHSKATHQCLLMGVQACRLPALKRLKTLQTLKTLKTLTTRHGGSKPAVCQALNTREPWHASSCSQQALQGHTSMSSYRRPQACRLPGLKHKGNLGMLHPAANRHSKATHQCLLMGVQACRLPALKRLKTLQTLKTLKTFTTRHGGSKPAVCQALNTREPWHASSCSQQALQGHTSMSSYRRPSLPFASPKHLKPLKKPSKRLKPLLQPVMGVQACHLPGPQGHTSMASYGRRKPAVCQALNIPLACFILQPTGTPRPHINVFLWASKPAVCQPLNA